MRRSLMSGLLVLVLLAVVGAWPLAGQTLGEITGVVADANGGVIVGASMNAINPQTGATRMVATNATGNYSLPAMKPGIYNVKVEADGFQPEIRTGVELQVQQVARIDFQLVSTGTFP